MRIIKPRHVYKHEPRESWAQLAARLSRKCTVIRLCPDSAILRQTTGETPQPTSRHVTTPSHLVAPSTASGWARGQDQAERHGRKKKGSRIPDFITVQCPGANTPRFVALQNGTAIWRNEEDYGGQGSGDRLLRVRSVKTSAT